MTDMDGALALTWDDWWDEHYRTGQYYTRPQLLALRRFPFLATARRPQRPPNGDWRTWLFIGGRGAGKTRAGAEWVRFAALYGGCRRIALIGPTLSDVREVMIEGPSGICTIEPSDPWRPEYNVSRRRLEWTNGAVAFAFSAEDAESLRGPQFDAAWCDEIAVWPNGETVWDNLQFGLRLGTQPRCVATTTPKPVPLVRRLMARGARVTHSTTRDNETNLADDFVRDIEKAYTGTTLARQELDGELIEDLEHALWRRSDIDRWRVDEAPERFDDMIVAIDPATTSHAGSDACGIIAAGVVRVSGSEDKCYILADATQRGLKPQDWAARALSVADLYGASCLVAEANQGGEMLRTIFESLGARLPIQLVHARLGKKARAMPVAALYGQGSVSHVGMFKALEDEMCRFGTDSLIGSPDRVDALVWAVSVLMFSNSGAPRIRGL